jgi:type I site-specific restriction-modification system R (restriction) subunit
MLHQHTSTKHQRTQHYTVKNSGRRAKTVLIEQPFDASWKLVTPQEPDEKTRNLYRFAVTTEPGKPAKLEVQEERVLSQQIALGNMDDNTIRYYINAPVVGEKVKQALQEIIDRKQKLSVVAAERQQLEQRIAEIGTEQDRIRQNMAQLDKNTDLYNRYVKKFGEQEDMIEKLRGQIAELTAEETRQRQALDEYLIGLDLS